MKILKDLSSEIVDTNSNHWNFESYEDNDGNSLAVGINWLSQKQYDFNRPYNSSRVVLFNNWAPCEYAQRNISNGLDAIHMEDKFDFVLTICPYTAKWRNLNSSDHKYIYSFYPYSIHLIPTAFEKKYDVIYHGGIHGKEHILALRVMRHYKYRYISLDYGINPLTRSYLRFATDINLPFTEKIQRIAETKISICFNLIHVSYRHYKNMMQYSSELTQDNEFFDSLKPINIFKNYPWIGVLPQFKTRIHEAAISRCINLVYNDGWNVIEDYYKSGKEFIYFSSEKDLHEKISYILSNWKTHEIQDIVESAYKKAMRYTSENFMRMYSNIISSGSPADSLTFEDDSFWDQYL
jgi:hypothetical protein